MPVSRSCLVSPCLPCRDLPREMPRELRRRDMVTGTSRRGIEASRDPIGSARIVSSLIQHLARAPVDGPARGRCSVSSTTAAAIPGRENFASSIAEPEESCADLLLSIALRGGLPEYVASLIVVPR